VLQMPRERVRVLTQNEAIYYQQQSSSQHSAPIDSANLGQIKAL